MPKLTTEQLEHSRHLDNLPRRWRNDWTLVFARRRAAPDEPDYYAISHTAITRLIDRSGEYITHWADARTTEDVIRGIGRLLVAAV